MHSSITFLPIFPPFVGTYLWNHWIHSIRNEEWTKTRKSNQNETIFVLIYRVSLFFIYLYNRGNGDLTRHGNVTSLHSSHKAIALSPRCICNCIAQFTIALSSFRIWIFCLFFFICFTREKAYTIANQWKFIYLSIIFIIWISAECTKHQQQIHIASLLSAIRVAIDVER